MFDDDAEEYEKIKNCNEKCNDLFKKIGKYDTDGRLIKLVEQLVDLRCQFNIGCLMVTMDKRYRQSYKILKWYADENNTGDLNRYAKNFVDKNENPFEV